MGIHLSGGRILLNSYLGSTGDTTAFLVHEVPLGWKLLYEDSGTESPLNQHARPGLPTSRFLQKVIKISSLLF